MKNFFHFFTEKRLIVVVVLFSILVRLLYLKIPFIINEADGIGYVTMADLALKGNWQSFLDDYTYRTPAYPFFIALFKIIFGKAFVVVFPWVQHALGVVMAVLVFQIGKKVFNKWVGFLAGVLTGINAYQIYWEHNSMTDFLFEFMAVLSFYLFLKALFSGKNREYVIFGIIFGLNLLVRPLLQLFIVVFPLLVYLFTKNIRETLKKLIFIMVPIVLIIAPWFWQNWTRHRFFGLNSYLGVQLMVRAQNYVDMESPLRSKEKKIYRQAMYEVTKCTDQTIKEGTCGQAAVAGWRYLQREFGYSPVFSDQILQEIAAEAIKKNPGRYFSETVWQLGILLTRNSRENFYGDLDLDSSFRQKYYQKFAEGDSWTIFHQKLNWNLTPKMINFVFLAILGVSIALFKRNFKAFIFISIVFYLLLVTCAIEDGSVTRYRIPADPYIFLFASYGVHSLVALVRWINKKYEECLVKE